MKCQAFPGIFYTYSYLAFFVKRRLSEKYFYMSPIKDMALTRKLGVGDPVENTCEPTDFWVAPIVRNTLVERFCNLGHLFLGLFDLDQLLISIPLIYTKVKKYIFLCKEYIFLNPKF